MTYTLRGTCDGCGEPYRNLTRVVLPPPANAHATDQAWCADCVLARFRLMKHDMELLERAEEACARSGWIDEEIAIRDLANRLRPLARR